MPMRAMSMCGETGCSVLLVRPGRCQAHARKPWTQERPSYKQRNGRLPSPMRKRVLTEEPACRRCGSEARPEVDHIDATLTGEARDMRANLQRLCHDCNFKKSKAEAAQARYGSMVSR